MAHNTAASVLKFLDHNTSHGNEHNISRHY